MVTIEVHRRDQIGFQENGAICEHVFEGKLEKEFHVGRRRIFMGMHVARQ